MVFMLIIKQVLRNLCAVCRRCHLARFLKRLLDLSKNRPKLLRQADEKPVKFFRNIYAKIPASSTRTKFLKSTRLLKFMSWRWPSG